MKKLILASAVLAAFASTASAQQAQPAPEHTFTGNVAVVTDYRFRGISQTFKKPAIQGGFDYAHSSGFYVGNWNSNVSGVQYPQGGSIEMDFYAGYKFEPVKDVTGDVGFLYYYYPGAKVAGTSEKFDNGEIYFAVGYKWFSAKYSYGVTDFFGLNNTTAGLYAFTALNPSGNSKGSGYLDLNANFEIADKTTLNLHVGRQTVKSYGALSYTDYKIGVARDFGFATLGLAVIGTDADKDYWQATNGSSTRKLGETTAVLSLSKTF
ncbi:hypothetical protein D3870_01215 [Noviherbaspirillum cavernae]|uniref:Uncharacterized protein n=1 Tax=Noviherbaspirillum cavernae TaxID=2320862 RepID=A0A418WX70_9BURK|nr:TorF family putative porin [Noviherbaspirillum cavernae]RJG04824.1 hypothetical protein D3870_01215 [Noviherbaspirillum cavernae]